MAFHIRLNMSVNFAEGGASARSNFSSPSDAKSRRSRPTLLNIRTAAVPVDTLRRSFRLALTALRPQPRIGIATSM